MRNNRNSVSRIAAAAALAVVITAAQASAQCVGDCDGNGSVAINELIRGVNISLGNANLSTCTAMDANGNGIVAINELIQAVNNALNGCPIVSTPTNTPTSTPTNTPVSESCGDGVIDTGEECDDGKHCLQGDGINDPCEMDSDCDESAPEGACVTRDGDGCQGTCALPVCGDGTTDNLGGTCDANTCVGPNSFAGAACSDDADCAGESCDDGNTEEGPDDPCPSNCRVAPCATTGATVDFDVTFTAPSGVLVAGLQFFIRYPDAAVSIPGSGSSPQVAERLSSDNFPSITVNDTNYGLNTLLLDSSLFGSESGTAATISFDRCESAPAPSAGDFSCTLISASDTSLTDISSQVTCAVAP